MNDLFMNEDFGRERLNDLIQEAEQERLAQKFIQANKPKQWQESVRETLARVMNTITLRPATERI